MKNSRNNVQIFQTRKKLTVSLAEKVTSLLQEAVLERNKAALVVSGGSTPKPLFEKLAQTDILWNRVTITLADERWVDPAQPESNERLVRNFLLREKAENAAFAGLKNSSPSAAGGERTCHEMLNRISRPFDVVILGMGNDGHTASLFPHSPILSKALDPLSRVNCLAVPGSDSASDRMTLTLSVLLDCRQIFVHITGKEKMAVLEQALAGGSVEDMPIRAVLMQNRTPVQIYWAP